MSFWRVQDRIRKKLVGRFRVGWCMYREVGMGKIERQVSKIRFFTVLFGPMRFFSFFFCFFVFVCFCFFFTFSLFPIFFKFPPISKTPVTVFKEVKTGHTVSMKKYEHEKKTTERNLRDCK